MALVEAGKIYRKHLNPFVTFFDVGKELTAIGGAAVRPVAAAAPAPAAAAPSSAPVGGAEGAEDQQRQLGMPISALDLSVRASNCLEAEGIQTVGDLVSRTEDEMLKLKNFGRTSLREVEKKLESMGLRFRAGAATAASPEQKG
jgi:DNA-directed RNA polymerase subunit alpha